MATTPRIVITDLPAGDALPDAAQEQIVGAGRLGLTTLGVEGLEDRQLLAANFSAAVTQGVLRIDMTNRSETLKVTETAAHTIKVTYNNAVVKTFDGDRVDRIVVKGEGGADTIDLRGVETKSARIWGGTGNDVITGTKMDDQIWGGVGNDTLRGAAGNDRLFGNLGMDKLHGGLGDDWLEAGSHREDAFGGDGMDFNPHRRIVNAVTKDDIHKGGAATCVFLSSLIQGAAMGVPLGGRIEYKGNFNFTVKLYNVDAAAWQNIAVTFDGGIVRDAAGTAVDAVPEGDHAVYSVMESWTILYQRAYVKMLGYDPTSADSVSQFTGEGTERPMKAVFGPKMEHHWIDTADGTAAKLQRRFDEGFPIVALTFPKAGDVDLTRFYNDHAYAVVNVETAGGETWVTVRDPYRQDGPGGAAHPDGLYRVSYADFCRNFGGYAWGK